MDSVAEEAVAELTNLIKDHVVTLLVVEAVEAKVVLVVQEETEAQVVVRVEMVVLEVHLLLVKVEEVVIMVEKHKVGQVEKEAGQEIPLLIVVEAVEEILVDQVDQVAVMVLPSEEHLELVKDL